MSHLTNYLNASSKAQVHPEAQGHAHAHAQSHDEHDPTWTDEDDDKEYELPLESHLRPKPASASASASAPSSSSRRRGSKGDADISRSSHSEMSHESMDSIGVASTGGHHNHHHYQNSTSTINSTSRSSRGRRHDQRHSQPRERSRSASGRKRRGVRTSASKPASSSSSSQPIQPPQQHHHQQPQQQQQQQQTPRHEDEEEETTRVIFVGGEVHAVSEHRRPRVTAHGLMMAEMRTKSIRKLQELDEMYSNHTQATGATAVISNTTAASSKLSSSTQNTNTNANTTIASSTTTTTTDTISTEDETSTRSAPRSRMAPARTKSSGKSRRAAAAERIRTEARNKAATTTSTTTPTTPSANPTTISTSTSTSSTPVTTTSTTKASKDSALLEMTARPQPLRRTRSTSVGRKSGGRGRNAVTRTKSMDDTDLALELSSSTHSKPSSDRQLRRPSSSSTSRRNITSPREDSNDPPPSSSGIQKSNHSTSSGSGGRSHGGSGSRHSTRGRTRQSSGSSHGKKSSSRSRSRSTRRRRRKYQAPTNAETATSTSPHERRRQQQDEHEHQHEQEQEHDDDINEDIIDDTIEDNCLLNNDSSKFLQLQLDTTEQEAPKVVGRSQKEYGVDHLDIVKNYSSGDEGLSLASDIDEDMELYGKPSSTSSLHNKDNNNNNNSKPSSMSSRSNKDGSNGGSKPSSVSSRSNKNSTSKPSSTSSRSNRNKSGPWEDAAEHPVSTTSINIPKNDDDDDDDSIDFASGADYYEEEEGADDINQGNNNNNNNNNTTKNNKKKQNFSELLNKSTTAFFDVSKKLLSGKRGTTTNNRSRSRSPSGIFPDEGGFRTKSRCLNELVRETSVRKLQIEGGGAGSGGTGGGGGEGGAIPENSVMAFPMTPSRKFGRPRLGNLLSRKKKTTMADSHAQLDEDDGSLLASPNPIRSPPTSNATSTVREGGKEEEACETLEEFFGAGAQGGTNTLLRGAPLTETAEEGTDSSGPQNHEETNEPQLPNIGGDDQEEPEVSVDDLAFDKTTRKTSGSSSVDNLETLFFNNTDSAEDVKSNFMMQSKMHHSMADVSRFVPLRQPSVRGLEENSSEVPGNNPAKMRGSNLEAIPDAPMEFEAMSPTPSSPVGLLPKSAKPRGPRRSTSLQSPGRRTSSGSDTGSDSPRTPSRHQSKFELPTNERLDRSTPSRSKSSDSDGPRPLGRNRTAPSRTRSSKPDLSHGAPRSPKKMGTLNRSKSGDGMERPRSVRGGGASPRGSTKSSKSQKPPRTNSSNSSKEQYHSRSPRNDNGKKLEQQHGLVESSGAFASPIGDGTLQSPNGSNQGPPEKTEKQGLICLAEASPLPGQQLPPMGNVMPVSIPTSNHGGGFASPTPRKHRGDDDSDSSDDDYGEELSPSVGNPTNYLQLAFDAPPPESPSPFTLSPDPTPTSNTNTKTVTVEEDDFDDSACAATGAAVASSSTRSKFSMSMSGLFKSPAVTKASLSMSTSNFGLGNGNGTRSNNTKKLPPLPPIHTPK